MPRTMLRALYGLQPDEGTSFMLRNTLIAATMGALLLTAAACNTVKGAGRDIESVGKAGQDAINKK
jgi:predicted small secreted protein